MDSLFRHRMAQLGGTVGEAVINNNHAAANKLFTADTACKKCFLYSRNHTLLDEVEAKFQVASNFSMLKDQVEYLLQFRPGFHPEKIYNNRGEMGALGFYIEIPDDTGELETWLIAGRNDRTQFVRYNIIKCNWLFKWVSNGLLYSCPGVLRYKGSLSRGLKEGTLLTTAENQNVIWLPDNEDTQTIRQDTRFLLSKTRALTFCVSKIEDTFPLGVVRLQLEQDQFNPNTDNLRAGIADYYTNGKAPMIEKKENPDASITISGRTNRLMIGGSGKTLTACFYGSDGELINNGITWEYQLNGKPATVADLKEKHIFTASPVPTAIKIHIREEPFMLPSLIGTILTITAVLENRRCSIDLKVAMA